jgi:exopolyphosphatase / guanosine-5'-triphosphate,3'-diphosphate pyrophosphatase
VRCSVLDLGSNSFHVLVADLDGTTLVPVAREREMLHLGRAVARHGRVPEDDVVRAETAVTHLTASAVGSGTEEHLAVATSAIRDAANGAEVLERLSLAAGTPVRTLSGDEEARLAYLGVRASVAVAEQRLLVLDLGGGSLELAVGTDGQVTWATSLPLGVSRLSALVDGDPIRKREVKALIRRVDDELAPLRDELTAMGIVDTVAVGGTVRALARVIAAEDAVWLPATLNQLRLTTDELARVRDELTRLDLDGRLALPGMKERRADHLHVAAVILGRVLERLGIDRFTVSDWGLREGLLLDAHGASGPPAPDQLRAGEVARLRATFPTDAAHLDHLARLAVELFDRLADLHGLAPTDRELLVHAVQLHEVGEAIALRRHPIHGAYIVTNAELRGFDPDEVAMLATLVRFHRSRGIDHEHPPFAGLPPDAQERTRRLLPLLRIADRFDRLDEGVTRDLDVTRDADTVVVRPVGAALPVAPLELERLTALFERTYGAPLRFAEAADDGVPT